MVLEREKSLTDRDETKKALSPERSDATAQSASVRAARKETQKKEIKEKSSATIFHLNDFRKN